jgi:hypothetical protein
MDFYNAGIGLLLFLVGILILVIQYRNGDFDKGSEITANTIGLVFAGITGVIAGIYFIITSI